MRERTNTCSTYVTARILGTARSIAGIPQAPRARNFETMVCFNASWPRACARARVVVVTGRKKQPLLGAALGFDGESVARCGQTKSLSEKAPADHSPVSPAIPAVQVPSQRATSFVPSQRPLLPPAAIRAVDGIPSRQATFILPSRDIYELKTPASLWSTNQCRPRTWGSVLPSASFSK